MAKGKSVRRRKATGRPIIIDTSEQRGFDFGEAIRRARIGHPVQRVSWRVEGRWLLIGRPAHVETVETIPVAAVQMRPCWFLYANGVFAPGWVPSFDDMIAEDWTLVTHARMG